MFVIVGNVYLINWVPRVNLSRDQFCVFQPMQVFRSTKISPIMNVPNPLDTQVSGLTARFTGTPPPVILATSAQLSNVPMTNVAAISSFGWRR